MNKFKEKLKTVLHIKNEKCRVVLAEFLGTFVLICLGQGAGAQSVLSRGASGEELSIHLGWGWAAAMGVWVSGGVSGGHINPAISLMNAVLGNISWLLLPFYMLSQFLAAFTASAVVYGIYYDSFENFDEGKRCIDGLNGTAGIFATYPKPFVSNFICFFDQIFTTMLLSICLAAMSDKRNMNTPPGAFPFCVHAIVAVMSIAYSYNCGCAMNPARDFSPRLFTAIAGWGWDVFSYHNYFFWIPMVSPLLGAVLGAWIYLLAVGLHIDDGPDNQTLDTTQEKTTEYNMTERSNHEHGSSPVTY